MDGGQFKKWIESLQRGEKLDVDPGPPLAKGPTEVITETRPTKKEGAPVISSPAK